jgi:ParB/RepB/Spo0J family partition protein
MMGENEMDENQNNKDTDKDTDMGTHPIAVTDTNVSPELAFGRRQEWVLPQDLRTSPRFEVRAYTGPGDEQAAVEEDRVVQNLARSLEQEGQHEPLVVVVERPTLGVFTVVCGHRRRRAALLINEQRTTEMRPLLKLRCTVFYPHEIDAERMAATNNIQRKDLTPLQKGRVFQDTRARKGAGWEGPKGTKKLAEYFSVSPALIIQCEKLLRPDCPAEIKSALAMGVLSAESAHLLMAEPGEWAGKLIARAREVQVEREAEKVLKAVARGGSGGKKAEAEGPERLKKAGEGRIEAPAVKRAIREAKEEAEEEKAWVEPPPPPPAVNDTANESPLPPPPPPQAKTTASSPSASPSLSRREAIDFFEQFDSPAYGHPNGACRQFVRFYVDQLTTGKGTEKQARKLWDALVERAPKGKAEVEKKSKPVVDKKQKAKPVGKKTPKPKATPTPKPKPTKVVAKATAKVKLPATAKKAKKTTPKAKAVN